MVSANTSAISPGTWVVMTVGIRGLSWKRITKVSDEIVPKVEVNMTAVKGAGIEEVMSLMGLDTWMVSQRSRSH